MYQRLETDEDKRVSISTMVLHLLFGLTDVRDGQDHCNTQQPEPHSDTKVCTQFCSAKCSVSTTVSPVYPERKEHCRCQSYHNRCSCRSHHKFLLHSVHRFHSCCCHNTVHHCYKTEGKLIWHPCLWIGNLFSTASAFYVSIQQLVLKGQTLGGREFLSNSTTTNNI